ncbi:UDP-N-acetylmuramate dehydrogenase [Pseudomonas mangiferae]|uniref:UDP-N-acetylenolpyruvoylglucosamine reductase n=1 Tax=Pseudomonas mangiferae TaxID=2593654 RepID=A0A553GZH8_9PSED|nr:UDP-N-acetylmuramate dehydrogenase [Pseudomonas mangiferae]TRX74889.1 UDP-N-acetylmuramate dehydrogenase [Pseudomonas mangiferae]
MSLQVREGVSLAPYNTFGIDVRARGFAEAQGEEDVRAALAEAAARRLPLLVLGGGSNLLLSRDVEALVLKMSSRGVRVLEDDGRRAILEAEAGEPWHPFVLDTLARGFAGLENLSLIPGTVGAAPVQNIGAYGVELKDVFAGLTALDRRNGELVTFDREACSFGYRDSLFKQEPDRWVILRVRFALDRQAPPHLDYGPLRQRLAESGIDTPSAVDVSRAVCAIRQEKLPDPAQLGNAGSFFKNPVVDADSANALRARYTDLVAYPLADGQVKLAAGWLIERAGWKGFREGDAGVHQQQALVLVNHGTASGAEILALARRIQGDILARFGVTLEMEPNLL